MQSEGPGNQNNEKNPLTKTKTLYTFAQYLDGDVCTPEDRNPKDEEYLCKFTKKMCQLKTDTPAVILPLIKTLYYTSEAHSELNSEPFDKVKTGITQIQEIVKDHPNISNKDVLRLLSFSDAERGYVKRTTSMQWQCEECYIHKTAFNSFKV